MTVSWDRNDGVLFGSLAGRIDSQNADEFGNLLEAGAGDDEANLVLDFSKVTFIASSGLRICLLTAKRFKHPGKNFAVCSLPPAVREVVEISGFHKLIAVYESRALAVEAIRGGSPDDSGDGDAALSVAESSFRKVLNRDILEQRFQMM